MAKNYNHLKVQRWLDQIYKLNNHLKKLEEKMPELLTTLDKSRAQVETYYLFRLAGRLEFQVKNAVEVNKSEIEK